MLTKTLKIVLVAAAMAAASAAPAFAWGSGGPLESYDQESTHSSGYYNYYDYAPGYVDQAPGVVRTHAHRAAAHRNDGTR